MQLSRKNDLFQVYFSKKKKNQAIEQKNSGNNINYPISADQPFGDISFRYFFEWLSWIKPNDVQEMNI